jgi:hypothetical protein
MAARHMIDRVLAAARDTAHRPAEQIALREVHPQRCQPLELLAGLDVLIDELEGQSQD